MLQQILMFLVGVVSLCMGADWLVRGATIIADRLQIPRAVIGLTMVAIGTSAPELVVNVLAARTGNTEFALPNVSGSNMANICLGLAGCGLLGGIAIRRKEFGWDAGVAFLSVAIVLICILFQASHQLALSAAIPLSLLLGIYGYSLSRRPSDGGAAEDSAHEPMFKGAGTFVLGVLGLYFGGNFVLDSTVAMAEVLNVGKEVIGLTVIAMGTSVPDITATLVAARRGETGIAVGNILGSNISNVVLVLNASLLASGASIPTTPEVRTDFWFVALVTAAVVGLVLFKQGVSRRSGGVLLGMYVAYLAYRISQVL